MVRLNDRKLSTASTNLKCVSLKEKRKIIDSKEKTGLIFQLCKILIQTETEKKTETPEICGKRKLTTLLEGNSPCDSLLLCLVN